MAPMEPSRKKYNHKNVFSGNRIGISVLVLAAVL